MKQPLAHTPHDIGRCLAESRARARRCRTIVLTVLAVTLLPIVYFGIAPAFAKRSELEAVDRFVNLFIAIASVGPVIGITLIGFDTIRRTRRPIPRVWLSRWQFFGTVVQAAAIALITSLMLTMAAVFGVSGVFIVTEFARSIDTKDWTETSATITVAAPTRKKADRGWVDSGTIEYTYIAGEHSTLRKGTTVRIGAVSDDAELLEMARTPVGSIVPAWYDPQSPSESVLKQGPSTPDWHMIALLPLLAVLAIGLVAMCFIFCREFIAPDRWMRPAQESRKGSICTLHVGNTPALLSATVGLAVGVFLTAAILGVAGQFAVNPWLCVTASWCAGPIGALLGCYFLRSGPGIVVDHTMGTILARRGKSRKPLATPLASIRSLTRASTWRSRPWHETRYLLRAETTDGEILIFRFVVLGQAVFARRWVQRHLRIHRDSLRSDKPSSFSDESAASS